MNVFKIAWFTGNLYEVSIHDYPGGDVVPYETAKALADELAAERAKVSKISVLWGELKKLRHNVDIAGFCHSWCKACELRKDVEQLFTETKPNEPKRLN